jgi:integrase
MEAATKFLLENQHKRSLHDDAGRLRELVKYIGDMSLDSIHIGALQPFIEGRKRDGVTTRTINHGLQVFRRILSLAASEWMDEYGLTWLVNAPKIKFLPEHDSRKPYPLTWDEQHQLFSELRWEWEIKIPELPHILVFIIPAELVKNGKERLVVCNDTALEVVNDERGKHLTHVFTYKGKPLARILSTGWRNARIRADLQHVRVHDLKHTFARRLRAAAVSFEDRQDLLGHCAGRITTHYSSAELQNLYEAANRVCGKQKSGVVLTLLRNPNCESTKANKLSLNIVAL